MSGFVQRPFGFRVSFPNGFAVSLGAGPQSYCDFPRGGDREAWANPWGLGQAFDAEYRGRAAEIADALRREDHGELETPDAALAVLVPNRLLELWGHPLERDGGKFFPATTDASEAGGHATPLEYARLVARFAFLPEDVSEPVFWAALDLTKKLEGEP